MNRTEYQVEYCAMKGKGKGGGAGGEGGPVGLTPCKNNEDVQPVGGRVQTKYREEMNSKRDDMEATLGKTSMAPATTDPTDENGYIPLGSSVYTEDYANELALEAEKQGALEAQQRGAYQMPWAPDFERRRELYMYRSAEITGPSMAYIPPATMQPQ